MSENKSALEEEVGRQVSAQKNPPASLMAAAGNAWFDDATGQINEPLLAAVLIDKYGLYRSGKQICDENGRTLTPATIRRYLSIEIGAYCPVNTSRFVSAAYKTLLDRLPENGTEIDLELFSVADLAKKEIPPTPFVVDQLLPCGLTIFAAPPKIGKSWLCLDLADAVASGSTFWGHQVSAGTVSYCAMEDSEGRLKQRLKECGSRMPERFMYKLRKVMTLDNGLLDQITAWINAYPDMRLIILDTLQKIKGATQIGLDAYAGDYARLAPLQELAIEKKVAIVLVHHFRKLGNVVDEDAFERISGSTAIFGAADTAWAIYGARNAEEKTFALTGRDVISDEFKIRFDSGLHRWQMLGNSEQLEAQRLLDEYNGSPIISTIRQLVKESGGAWEGKYEDLKEEIMRRTQKIPATSSKAFYSLVAGMQEQLLTLDGIAFTHGGGGRAGRFYRFASVKQEKLI